MLMRLQWYDITVIYRKGKEMHVSDALSRAFLQTENQHSEFDRQEDMINMLSVSNDKYAEIKSATQTELSALYKVIIDGWPDTRSETPVEVRPYWDSRDQLSVLDGIIYKGLRLVIPPSLLGNMLELIHKSHLGMSKCKQRAREVMYWPCMNSDIDSMVSNCTQCNEYQKQQPAEPLKPTPTPDLQFSFVGCDIFDFESKKYLLVVDYYSKYIDVAPLQFENAKAIIEALKPIFACHGIPVKLRSDNGPQFSSNEFKKFCASIGIESETASPHFQSSNGEAERVKQIVKHLWRKNEDKQMCLLDYRTTPLEGINMSPSQLLMGRRPRNILPTSNDLLKPNHNTNLVKKHFDKEKQKQKFHRRGVKELPSLSVGEPVRVSPTQSGKSAKWNPGTVIEKHSKPRSYIVSSGTRLYRRNRKFLRPSKFDQELDEPVKIEPNMNDELCQPEPESTQRTIDPSNSGTPNPAITVKPPVRVTRSGKRVKTPKKVDS
ncbi:uncharacterized protein K02A2.6-like [Ylistrum balloti]|uniref:uncharacterized protein K02A2.6-like n=1 Tax=Ylistrum balloti TaxID=509963 RepID=UPI002905DE86|nr:uncharacterized protein K02A2.6-like [Ylistrum balloti]